MSVKLSNRTGITCGRREIKGVQQRCVLWDDDEFEWFNLTEFMLNFGV